MRLGNILPPPGIDIDNFIDNESFAIFAQGTFDLSDKLSLTGGIRWTKDEKKYTTAQIIAGIPVTVVDGANDAEFDAVTGRGGLEYRWNDELLTQTFENDPELFQDSHHLLDASIAYADLNGDWSLTLGEMRIPGQGA